MQRSICINQEINYLSLVEDSVFVDCTFDACRASVKRGYLFTVPNQAGIGRGYYLEEDFLNLTNWMKTQFEDQGIQIDGACHCSYQTTEGIGKHEKNSEGRKTGPGMILKVSDAFDLDLAPCVVLGTI